MEAMDTTSNIINEETVDTVAEVTEEIIKKAPKSNFGVKAVMFGLTLVAGGLICHFAVEPTVAKVGDWIEKRKERKSGNYATVDSDDDDVTDFMEIDETTIPTNKEN